MDVCVLAHLDVWKTNVEQQMCTLVQKEAGEDGRRLHASVSSTAAMLTLSRLTQHSAALPQWFPW